MHGTVRDPNKESSVGHLKALPGASERLKLFAADLLEVRDALHRRASPAPRKCTESHGYGARMSHRMQLTVEA